MQKHLLVIAEPVKKIEHRIALRLLHVVTRRKQNAVRHGTRKNLALNALAFHAAGSLRSNARRYANQQSHRQRDLRLTHTAWPPPDSAAPRATPDRVPPPGSPQSKTQSRQKSATQARKTHAPAANSVYANKHSFPTSLRVRSASPSKRRKYLPSIPSRRLRQKTAASRRGQLLRALSAPQSRAGALKSPSPAY